MNTKYDYDDIVLVRSDAPTALRPGSKAWVVGVTDKDMRRGSHYDAFPAGNVYTIEFEDGASVDVHEEDIDIFEGKSSAK